jgi:hypothetical protein
VSLPGACLAWCNRCRMGDRLACVPKSKVGRRIGVGAQATAGTALHGKTTAEAQAVAGVLLASRDGHPGGRDERRGEDERSPSPASQIPSDSQKAQSVRPSALFLEAAFFPLVPPCPRERKNRAPLPLRVFFFPFAGPA